MHYVIVICVMRIVLLFYIFKYYYREVLYLSFSCIELDVQKSLHVIICITRIVLNFLFLILKYYYEIE